jgi:hypothetical protein
MLNLLDTFSKNIQYQISQKSVQWELRCTMWTDIHTDGHDNANSHFSQFCEHAKKLDIQSF